MMEFTLVKSGNFPVTLINLKKKLLKH